MVMELVQLRNRERPTAAEPTATSPFYPFLFFISTSSSKEGSTYEPPYMALFEMLLPTSNCIVLRQLLPIFGVTFSLMRLCAGARSRVRSGVTSSRGHECEAFARV